MAFLVVPCLSRTCIIGINVLDEHRANINLDTKTLTFPYLEGQPAIRIVKDEEKKRPNESYNICRVNSETLDSIKWEQISTEREETLAENLPLNILQDEIQEKINENINLIYEEKKQLGEILCRHKKVFRRKPGLLTQYEHVLKVKESQPFAGRSYPIPMAHREKVGEEVQRMLKMGIIQRSNSPYINPIVPVIKKDETIRLCIDARGLEEILIEDCARLEPAEVLFQKCKGMNIMSYLDMTSSFWQVPLHPTSRKYTAFQHR
ncbi:uncharacterized protein LOC117176592 [Belonocnema kinseyi]|uniref:uncharacterized protein LOC117176592 n=1 Tax=Belonocnema kinseyi TaxID=2817044 RepID=UPI00143CD1A8|nr:uncharacterized protein LOC117176592 [Belonocnema kinseyi]